MEISEQTADRARAQLATAARRVALHRLRGLPVPSSAELRAATLAFLARRNIPHAAAYAAHVAADQGLPHNSTLAYWWRRAALAALIR